MTNHTSASELRDALLALKPTEFEKLIAALLSQLLDLPVINARSGYQFGGDGGTAGAVSRYLRFECKRYRDHRSLNARELLGEIDQALMRDPALELWILVATCDVGEQLAEQLHTHGKTQGIPVLIVDWRESGIPPLGALCAVSPELVGRFSSTRAKQLASDIAANDNAISQIDAIRKSALYWLPGYTSIRNKSIAHLEKMWSSKQASRAYLGQDTAVGARPNRVRRTEVYDRLSTWWNKKSNANRACVLVGREGRGKTWALMDWLYEAAETLPIVLFVPAVALTPPPRIRTCDIKKLLTEALENLDDQSDAYYWESRLERILCTQDIESPRILLIVDGLNEMPSVSWQGLFDSICLPPFSQKVLLICTVRDHYFEEQLNFLRSAPFSTESIAVGPFDTAEGGEFDQMLQLAGLTKDDLREEVIEYAIIPRLFDLVLRFRSDLSDVQSITAHQLLWAYGRDISGVRAGKSFSPQEWIEWLAEIGTRYRNGFRTYSEKLLGKTIERADLSQDQVYSRLSTVVDGWSSYRKPLGGIALDETIVNQGLAIALIGCVETAVPYNYSTIDALVCAWLEPIDGFDERSEVLRAAVSVLVYQEDSPSSILLGVLVTAWLQSQNRSSSHSNDLQVLTPHIVEPLLDAVEHSTEYAQSDARLQATNLLRRLPRNNRRYFRLILNRSQRWLSIISRDVRPIREGEEKLEERRVQRMLKRVGLDQSGPIAILGNEMEMVDCQNGELHALVPSLIEGYPLAETMDVLEVGAISSAIEFNSNAWSVFKWLYLLNEVDYEETMHALRERSRQILVRPLENGINVDVRSQVSRLLLLLTGNEEDELNASNLRPDLYFPRSYREEYLRSPSRSFFPLERRHANEALCDTHSSLIYRVGRTKDLWLDPDFIAPTDFVDELRQVASAFAIDTISSHMSRTAEDYNFEELTPVLARCAPDLLKNLVGRYFASFYQRESESRYASALGAKNYALLVESAERAAIRELRSRKASAVDSDEWIADSYFLMLEILGTNSSEQIETVMTSDLGPMLADFENVISPPTSDIVDSYIRQYGEGTSADINRLISVLSIHPKSTTETSWSWLTNHLDSSEETLRSIAYRTLALSNGKRFGELLLETGWAWKPDDNLWVNHFGSTSLIEASLKCPFEEIAPRLAPWLVLRAARLRGERDDELEIAGAVIDHALINQSSKPVYADVNLTVHRSAAVKRPFIVSVDPPPLEENENDLGAQISAALDVKARNEALQIATKSAEEQINAARRQGASLYLATMSADDFRPLTRSRPDLIARWIDGYEEQSTEFVQRVRLAEGAFLGICEALIAKEPIRGVELWHSLRDSMFTTVLGDADVPELIHIAFRSPDSKEVEELRDGLLDLKFCHTDKALFEIVLAAEINGKRDWIEAVIERDCMSLTPWVRKRSSIMKGFTARNKLPIAQAWPDTEIVTTSQSLEVKSARRRYFEACAHHWWAAYLCAENIEEAFADWMLFVHSADRRARCWMNEANRDAPDCTELWRRKLAHARLNDDVVKRHARKQEDKLDRQFLGRDVVDSIFPWGTS